MPVIQDNAAQRAGYWPVPIARAIPALLLGLFITFSPNHAPQIGLVAFGVFGILTGVILVVFSILRLADQSTRMMFVIQGSIAGIAGIVALILYGSGLAFLLYLLSVFFALTGFLELYSGLRARGRSAASRDWLTVGCITAVMALVFLVIPPDTIFAIGILGVYGIILGVYLVIAGLSLKWGSQGGSTAAAAPASTIGNEK